jgi:HEAT repeat protein
VQLAQLPTARLVAVAGRIMQYNTIDGRATDLVVTILARRRTEPGVAALLREAARKPPAQFPMAVSKAALALAAIGDPASLPDMLRMLAVRQGNLQPAKKALIDMVAKNPRLLSQPATEIMLRAVMKERETDALVAAASHALAGIHTAASRDALAASPLFTSRDPALRMRALWDLGAHPAPYPPAAIAQLRTLAKDEQPQVRSEAAKLLAKSGQKV